MKRATVSEQSSIKLHFLKLLSLLVAFFIWFYVLNSEPLSVSIKMGLQISPPTGTAVGNKLPEYVMVKIKGPRAFIRNIKIDKQKNVFVKMNKKERTVPVTKEIELTENMITLPLGISVEEITPTQIKVRLEKKIKKYVPLYANLVGALDPQYKMVKSELALRKILISGPIETMRGISKLSTRPIDKSTLQKRGEFSVSIVNPDSRIKLEQQSVEYSYVLRPKTANLMLKNIPIRFLSSSRSIYSTEKVASLSVLVGEGREKSIKKKNIQVIADIPEGRKGKMNVQLRVNLPEDIHLLQIFPSTIKVNVR